MQVCCYFVIRFRIVLARLHGTQRDLHCNPAKVVVSGKFYLFLEGENGTA